MKVCPYCSAQNQDQAAVCYYCRSDLSQVAPRPTAPADNQERTQPLPVNPPRPPAQTYSSRPASPSDTQPMHGSHRSGSAPYQGQFPPPPPTSQAFPTQQPTNPPYYSQTPSTPPQYAPYAPPSAPSQPKTSIWPVAIILLALLLFCIGGFALWTIGRAAGGVGWFGGGEGAQPGGAVAEPTSMPVIPLPLDTPTPWPTFTSPPVDTLPPPTETTLPNPTDEAAITKLLSPECSAALEHLEALSAQLAEQPTSPLKADWRAEFSQAVDDMKTYCGTLENASPVPGILEETQRNLTLASTEFDQAKALFNEGVETLSPTKLLEAARHIGKASEHLQIALAELRKIGR